MAKSNDNFLRGWARQLRAALDEGGELAYEVAELIAEAYDLVTEPVGDDDVGVADGGDDGDDGDGASGLDEGDEEGLLRGAPDLGDRVRDRRHEKAGPWRVDDSLGRHTPHVPGASSGDAGRAASLTPTCKRDRPASMGRR